MNAVKLAIILTGMLAIGAAAHAQSLGDVARQNRQQQTDQEQSGKDKTPKVYTNEDLPQEGLADDDASSSSPSHSANAPSNTAQQTANEQVAKAAQMKAKIKAQENSIAELQSQIFRLKSTIRYADSSLYYNAAAYNERQDDKQHEVERMQEKLDGEKTKLQQLQDDAKRAGFGNAVYEP